MSGGRGGGQLEAAERVAVDSDYNVYVTDRYGRCMKKFSSDGRLVGRWGDQDQGWNWPPDLAVDGTGNVFVTDAENNRIRKFAPPKVGIDWPRRRPAGI